MFSYSKLFSKKSYVEKYSFKKKWYLKCQKALSNHHFKNCEDYRQINQSLFRNISSIKNIIELPYIHISTFKKKNLISQKQINLLKSFKSSGTTSNNRSKVFIDNKTSVLQSKALNYLFKDIIKREDPIFFLANKKNILSNEKYSAKYAAVRGFSQMTNDRFFLLNNQNKLNLEKLNKILTVKKRFIIFGFTYDIWSILFKYFKMSKKKIKKNKGILIHGGGWKKMEDKKINNKIFKKKIKETLGVEKVINYYGMIEQTGSVFLECEEGFFHPSVFSDILIRDTNLNLSKKNEKGIVQVMSLLPLSYPGHNIMTEDIGTLHGIDNCKCGRKDKYFTINGRIEKTEIRGCADV